MKILTYLLHPTLLWEDTSSLQRVSGYEFRSGFEFRPPGSSGPICKPLYTAIAFFRPIDNDKPIQFHGNGPSKRAAIEKCRRAAREYNNVK